MKISDVNVIILESPDAYQAAAGGQEAHGIKYLGIVKVENRCGHHRLCGPRTQPHVAQAIVNAPSEGSAIGFKGLRSVLIGEDPFDVERLWHKMYMGSVYYGRRGVAMQVISGIDIALWDIIGKKNRGAGLQTPRRRLTATVYAPTPAPCSVLLPKAWRKRAAVTWNKVSPRSSSDGCLRRGPGA